MPDSKSTPALTADGACLQNARTPAEVEAWIVAYIARVLALPQAAIGRSRSFKDIGLDSMVVVVMTEELGGWLRRDIDPTTAYSYPTVSAFAAHVLANAPEI